VFWPGQECLTEQTVMVFDPSLEIFNTGSSLEERQKDTGIRKVSPVKRTVVGVPSTRSAFRKAKYVVCKFNFHVGRSPAPPNGTEFSGRLEPSRCTVPPATFSPLSSRRREAGAAPLRRVRRRFGCPAGSV